MDVVPHDCVHRPVHRGVRGGQGVEHHAVHTVADVRLVLDVGRIGGVVLFPVGLCLLGRGRDGNVAIAHLVGSEGAQFCGTLHNGQRAVAYAVADGGGRVAQRAADGRSGVCEGIVQRRAVVEYARRQRDAVRLHFRLEINQICTVVLDARRKGGIGVP